MLFIKATIPIELGNEFMVYSDDREYALGRRGNKIGLFEKEMLLNRDLVNVLPPQIIKTSDNSAAYVNIAGRYLCGENNKVEVCNSDDKDRFWVIKRVENRNRYTIADRNSKLCATKGALNDDYYNMTLEKCDTGNPDQYFEIDPVSSKHVLNIQPSGNQINN